MPIQQNQNQSDIDSRLYFKTYYPMYRLVSHIQSNPQESPNGYTYHGIITSFGPYPCMYIFFPSEHPLIQVERATCDHDYPDHCMSLDIPTGAGEVTGSYEPGRLPQVDMFLSREEQKWSFGYDFGHGRDFNYNEYLSGHGLSINGHRWTVEEIEGWLREGFKQLIEYENLNVEEVVASYNSSSSDEDWEYDDYDDDDYYTNESRGHVMTLTESQIGEIVLEGIKRVLSEISAGLVGRAADAAHKDMMQNWNDSKIRGKRERQWKNFSKERIRMDAEEKNSVCPSVPESELANMPRNTYVIMDGDGRDAISADFRMRYSGHAGTMEQCEEYVKRFYDASANWEYLPSILSLEEYFKYKHNNK